MPKKEKKRFPLLPVVLCLAVVAAAYWFWQERPGYDIQPGVLVVEKAFHAQESELMVEVEGVVVRVLETHAQSGRYQEFVIRLSNGQSVHVVHDTAYAERVPLSVQHKVTVRGEYMWTEGGGRIIHTHHDRSTQRRHGWIEHQGEKYE